MAYVVRSKDNPGEVGRAADQQQSIDNESALYAAVLGAGPVATGGMVRQFVKKTGMADNVATEVFTITTTNEAGNTDGGAYIVSFNGAAFHAAGAAGDNAAAVMVLYRFARAQQAAGTGQNSAVNDTAVMIAESEGGATKGIASVLMTVVETSEYVMSVQVAVNIDGTAVTTATVIGMVDLYYYGYTTPPVITSAG